MNQILSKGLHNSDGECLKYTTDLMDRLEKVGLAGSSCSLGRKGLIEANSPYNVFSSLNPNMLMMIPLPMTLLDRLMWNNLDWKPSSGPTTLFGPTKLHCSLVDLHPSCSTYSFR